jgi:hypothetical protein
VADHSSIGRSASGLEDGSALAALHRVELRRTDEAIAASMRQLSDNIDVAAWEAPETGDEVTYDLLFRQSQAVSALAFALSDEPDEAIYEAAHALGTPEDLIRALGS